MTRLEGPGDECSCVRTMAVTLDLLACRCTVTYAYPCRVEGQERMKLHL